jgi:murein DD-endopeptidase MepM/ murein hydrolase activator NlpD
MLRSRDLFRRSQVPRCLVLRCLVLRCLVLRCLVLRNLVLALGLVGALLLGGAEASGSAEAGSVGFGSAGIGSDLSPVAGRLVSYRAPLAGQLRVVRSFQPPPEKYQAGHLGVDLASPLGSSVLAAGSGVVRFAGQVAGRGVLVIAHPDGMSTEYEPITAAVAAGDQVRAGQAIGLIAGLHRGCLPTGCLHWGARRGSDYLDPLQLLQPAGVVRLLPWNYRWPDQALG